MRLNTTEILLKRRQSNVERVRIERYHNPDDWVEMRINPQRITVTSRKVIQRVQTNTRWVFQHWGMEPVVIRYSGVTGYIQSVVADVITPLGMSQDENPTEKSQYVSPSDGYVSPYETPAFQALAILREFYEQPHKELQGTDLTAISGQAIDENLRKLLLKFTYRDGSYIGYLTMMEIQEDESSPWMWNYSMEFIALYHRTRVSLNDQTISELVRALFALSPGFNMSSDNELQNAWRRGIATSTTGEFSPRRLYQQTSSE